MVITLIDVAAFAVASLHSDLEVRVEIAWIECGGGKGMPNANHEGSTHSGWVGLGDGGGKLSVAVEDW